MRLAHGGTTANLREVKKMGSHGVRRYMVIYIYMIYVFVCALIKFLFYDPGPNPCYSFGFPTLFLYGFLEK